MAFNGSGTYVLPGAALSDGQTISATEHNTLRNDMATALTTCVTRDGQSPATANLPMGGFKLTGLSDGTGTGESLHYGQRDASGGIPGLTLFKINFKNAANTFTSFFTNTNTAARTYTFQDRDGTIADSTGIQNQDYTSFTTGGTSVAFTLTPTPASIANVAGQEFDVTFNAEAGTNPTLSVSGLPALNLKYRDNTGAKQAITSTQVPNGWRSKVVNDGTDWVVREIPSSLNVPVRQTVLNGPVDSSGFSAFGGSTGSTTVTASGILTVTASNGFYSNGAIDRVGQITNPSWTGLSTNGIMYLYLDVASGGVVTTGSTTLAPVYQWGGAYSTTSGQNTFNIQEMIMKVGNGATSTQVYRVFVGEVTVAVGVVTAITWYAIMGRYDSGWTNTLPNTNTAISRNHNIGIKPKHVALKLKCLTTDAGYAVGDELLGPFGGNMSGTLSGPVPPWYTNLTCGFTTPDTQVVWVVQKTSGGAYLTLANWAYAMQCERGW